MRELAAAGITIISGGGNSGPGHGTLMNPADDPAVVGVGGLDENGALAAWSSRGMTTWELPHGYGRAGIDVVTYGEFWGKAPRGGCQHQWGTSVACPVVVGVLALLLSELPPARRALLLNPAAIKQVLVEAAEPMPRISHMEQGMGELRPLRTAEAMRDFAPHLSAIPPRIDLAGTAPDGGDGGGGDGGAGCEFMWPFCATPLYVGSQPLVLNLTLLNSRAAISHFARSNPNPNPNPYPNPDPNPNPNPDPDRDPDPSQGGALHAFDRAFGYVFAGLMLADFAQRTMRTPLLKVHHATCLALTL